MQKNKIKSLMENVVFFASLCTCQENKVIIVLDQICLKVDKKI